MTFAFAQNTGSGQKCEAAYAAAFVFAAVLVARIVEATR
jgi:hypothetical protein